MKKHGKLIDLIIRAVILAAAGWVVLSYMLYACSAEGVDYAPLYVTADVLNGRAHPTRKAPVEAVFDYGDQLTPTGRISRDCEWVEVEGGEAGTVWVHVNYISERFVEFTATNENNGKIKIRSKIGGGKVRGYVKRGKSVEIDRVVLGWGHCKKGWIDLEYLIEEGP